MSKSLLVVGLALVAVTACGAGPQTPAAAHTGADPVAVYHQFAQCIRGHGYPNFPDPTLDGQGHPQLPPGTQQPPGAVMSACQSILDQLPASERPQQRTPNDPAMMRRFAQCMRAHGIDDWPDPNANGDFPMPPSLGNLKTSPRWSQIRALWQGPCKQYDPSGKIGTTAQ
jgi:hypothetical protein